MYAKISIEFDICKDYAVFCKNVEILILMDVTAC